MVGPFHYPTEVTCQDRSDSERRTYKLISAFNIGGRSLTTSHVGHTLYQSNFTQMADERTERDEVSLSDCFIKYICQYDRSIRLSSPSNPYGVLQSKLLRHRGKSTLLLSPTLVSVSLCPHGYLQAQNFLATCGRLDSSTRAYSYYNSARFLQ